MGLGGRGADLRPQLRDGLLADARTNTAGGSAVDWLHATTVVHRTWRGLGVQVVIRHRNSAFWINCAQVGCSGVSDRVACGEMLPRHLRFRDGIA
jgi:hypothetical protein